jgi:hypothetical protein
MSLDDWRKLTYLTADANLYFLLVAALVGLYFVRRISVPMRVIVAYLAVSSALELVSKYGMIKELPPVFFNRLNYTYVWAEAALVGTYLYLCSRMVWIRRIVLVSVGLFLMGEIYYLYAFSDPDPSYVSASAALFFILVFLVIMFDLSVAHHQQIFYTIPEVIVIIGFLMAYVMLLLVFFVLPSLIEYSKTAANQLLILRNSIGLLFYVLLMYGLWKSSLKRLR